MRTAIFFKRKKLKAFKAAVIGVVTLAVGFVLFISSFILLEPIAIVPDVHPYAIISMS
ncbi:MAG: hypothetical protein O3C64_01700 [Proteobacteria bacterium]|nr:hypothetical protein [Pseudomonadota bacterium]MDA1181058.1 hypothetical protein [Pseudomonadota bacterium]